MQTKTSVLCGLYNISYHEISYKDNIMNQNRIRPLKLIYLVLVIVNTHRNFTSLLKSFCYLYGLVADYFHISFYHVSVNIFFFLIE